MNVSGMILGELANDLRGHHFVLGPLDEGVMLTGDLHPGLRPLTGSMITAPLKSLT